MSAHPHIEEHPEFRSDVPANDKDSIYSQVDQSSHNTPRAAPVSPSSRTTRQGACADSDQQSIWDMSFEEAFSCFVDNDSDNEDDDEDLCSLVDSSSGDEGSDSSEEDDEDNDHDDEAEVEGQKMDEDAHDRSIFDPPNSSQQVSPTPPPGLTPPIVLKFAEAIEPPKTLERATPFYPWELRLKKEDDDKDDKPIYHSKAHLSTNEEALLIDPGAYDNLTGSEWAERQGAIAVEHGHEPSYYDLPKVMRAQGVGKEAQETTKVVRMPGQLENGQSLQYTAPVIPRWGEPALCGLKSLAANDAIMDCRTPEQKLYLGADTKNRPGTWNYNFATLSGHVWTPDAANFKV